MILQEHPHSALHTASNSAAGIGRLYNVFLVVSTIMYVAVIGVALWAAWRRRSVDEIAELSPTESRASRTILLATIATVVVLFVVLVYDLALARSLGHMSGGQGLSIRLTGHQWWWEVEYEDPVPQQRVRTANEIHIPVGRPVILKLSSGDVIHSFWAPSLGVKKDLIPGHPNEVRLEASRAGTYRAPCAEFCGLQHANMALYVVAEDEGAFAAWLDAQRRPSPIPSDTLVARGKTVFETGTCVMCHTITGTLAAATIGPDLTHLASRPWLASGTLPNTRGNLAGWIVEPQRIKPGVLMPSNALETTDLHALLAYLGTLR